MVNQLIEILFYIFGKLLNFLFGSYILEGVSLGMILVVAFMFTVMLQFLVSVPIVRGGGNGEKDYSRSGSRS